MDDFNIKKYASEKGYNGLYDKEWPCICLIDDACGIPLGCSLTNHQDNIRSDPKYISFKKCLDETCTR